MFEEDAIAEMDELGHSFFVFVNAETERLAVLYRRDDGDFGLIEPIVGGEYAASESAGYGSKASRSGPAVRIRSATRGPDSRAAPGRLACPAQPPGGSVRRYSPAAGS